MVTIEEMCDFTNIYVNRVEYIMLDKHDIYDIKMIHTHIILLNI